MRATLLVLVFLVLAGCTGERYEIVATSSSGEFTSGSAAYRLDKKTGEVIFIKGTQGRRVEMPQ
jgi:hypothetical protein